MDATIGGNRREPWNKRKLVGRTAPLKVKDIWAIRVRVEIQQRARDLALFDLDAIHRRPRNLRAVQLALSHTKLESTLRYLGIEVDDALEIAEQTEV